MSTYNTSEDYDVAETLRTTFPIPIWITWLLKAVYGVILCTLLAGNSLVIVSFIRFRTLRTVSHYFVLSLSLADTVTGVISIPGMFQVQGAFTTPAICQFYFSVDTSMSAASILNILAINVDRYIAITRPLLYPIIMTSRRAVAAILGVWTLAIAAGLSLMLSGLISFELCAPSHSVAGALVPFMGFFLLPFVITSLLLAHVHRLVVKHQTFDARSVNMGASDDRQSGTNNDVANSTERRSMPGSPDAGNCDQEDVPARQCQGSPPTKLTQAGVQNRKAVKLIAAILISFGLSWGFYYALVVMSVFTAEKYWNATFMTFIYVSLVFIQFSSAVNPCIYAFYSKPFRRAFRKALRCPNSLQPE